MRVVGIVAEYNPLHNGHIYHMEESVRQAGAEGCIVAMSGNFVQRGEPACTDKFTRAEWAVMGGADVVVEIPTVFAAASAERFAEGAVKTLAATGVVTDLAFGVETDDVNALYHLADLLDREPANLRVYLLHHLKQGKSFPRAQYEALADLGVPEDELSILQQPNNILAVEYLKSIRRYAPEIRPLPIQRIGNRYNSTVLTGKLSSATAIREALLNGDESVYDTMPMSVAAAMRFDAQFPVTFDRFSSMLLYRLRSMTVEELASLPDVSEGFEQVLYKAARQAVDLPSLLEAIKSKRYTLARCKRILVSALLHIPAGFADTLGSDPDNLYLHVLGLKRVGRGLLAAMASRGSAPVILRHADVSNCTDAARASLAIDALSTDLYAYALERDLHRDSQSAITV
ncbi:MAG: nucleotidyltransferase family protein [Clostridia bacterium]|nr:nucleotidyltransferase family protein [Clostridia bacterium]